MNTQRILGSLIGLLIQMEGFNLIQILMNLVIMSIDHFLSLTYLMKHPQMSPTHNLSVNKHAFYQTPIDYDKLRPSFGWVNSDIVKQTID